MIGPAIERVSNFRVGNIPLGKIGLLTVGLGVAAPLLAQVYRVSAQIPPAATGLGAAWLVKRFGGRVLGETGSEVAALSLGWTGVEGQMQGTRQIQMKLAQALAPRTVAYTPPAGALPVTPTAAAVAAGLTEVEGKIVAALQSV